MGISLLSRLSGALRFVRRAMSFPAAIVTVSALAACGGADSLLAPANNENTDRQFQVWAMTGTSAALPSGYRFSTESAVRPQVLAGGSLNFDVAFDLGPDGLALVLPAKAVVPQPPAGVASIGIQPVAGIYEQVQRAPESGYRPDTAITMAVGKTIVLRLEDSGCPYREPFYAKLAIDSINVVERFIIVRSLVDRNCGYKSLMAGIPKN
jgi:hypothetical protein